MAHNKQKLDRRQFLKQSTLTTAAITTGLPIKHVYAARKKRSGKAAKKVIVIGFDGMDPRLSEKMMNNGLLPNLARFRKQQGYQVLGTSIPPQSPVAWAWHTWNLRFHPSQSPKTGRPIHVHLRNRFR